jgi:hypothetical protein
MSHACILMEYVSHKTMWRFLFELLLYSHHLLKAWGLSFAHFPAYTASQLFCMLSMWAEIIMGDLAAACVHPDRIFFFKLE